MLELVAPAKNIDFGIQADHVLINRVFSEKSA